MESVRSLFILINSTWNAEVFWENRELTFFTGKSKANVLGSTDDAVNFPLFVVDKQVIGVELNDVYMEPGGVLYNGCEVYLQAGYHTAVR